MSIRNRASRERERKVDGEETNRGSKKEIKRSVRNEGTE
jgi:hypothetical protein